jgi:hypothetical protein
MFGTTMAVPCWKSKATFIRGVAQPGLARLLGVQEVAGSNPVAPIFGGEAAKNREESGEGREESKENQVHPLSSVSFLLSSR